MPHSGIETLYGTSERINVEDYRKAMLNILDDFSEEKIRLEKTQRAVLNILEDFTQEKSRLEETQRAMLNLLDDFSMEREKTEAINRELREAEEQVNTSLLEKVVLLKEIHHRVKNNLQIIHSILNLQMSQIKDERDIEMFKESKNRVCSMALIHEKLYQSESLAKIELKDYIKTLISNLFISYGTATSAIRPVINVAKITLDIDTVIPCALIINELVSNALKYAFPVSLKRAGIKNEIRIELAVDMDKNYELTIGDNGTGLPETFNIEKNESLGLKMVSVLVKQLKGKLDIKTNNGTEFIITFKALR